MCLRPSWLKERRKRFDRYAFRLGMHHLGSHSVLTRKVYEVQVLPREGDPSHGLVGSILGIETLAKCEVGYDVGVARY